MIGSSFLEPPVGTAMTGSDFLKSALDQPMSVVGTFLDQDNLGIRDTFGLGTAIRELELPEEAPTTPDMTITPLDTGVPVRVPDTAQMRRRITGFESIMGADLQDRQETSAELEQRRSDAGALSEDAYRKSPSFRQGIPWDAGMTADRAAALASQYDVRKVREFYGEKRPVLSFFGRLAGGFADPINYIPIFGEEVAAANIARFGTVTGRALTSSADAVANTALAGLVTQDARRELGDDVSWQATISQLGMAALIGGAAGALHGRFGRQPSPELRVEAETKLATLERTQEARVVLNDALDGIINRGEVEISPASADFVNRVADRELPRISIDRMAREADPEAFTRLETLDRVSQTNLAEISRLRSQSLDNERYGPTQRAMIEADQINDRVQRAEQNIVKASSEKERALATARRDALRQELREKIASIDDSRVQEIEDLNNALKARQAANAPVEAERAQLQERTRRVRDDALDRFWQERRSRPISEPVANTDQSFNGDDLPGALVQGPRGQVEAIASDNSAPKPPVAKDAIEASMRVGKTELNKDFARQMRIDPETGDFAERGELDQLIAEERVSEDDAADLVQADEDFKTASAWGEALKAAMSCTV